MVLAIMYVGLAVATGVMYLVSLVGFICLFVFYTKVTGTPSSRDKT